MTYYTLFYLQEMQSEYRELITESLFDNRKLNQDRMQLLNKNINDFTELFDLPRENGRTKFNPFIDLQKFNANEISRLDNKRIIDDIFSGREFKTKDGKPWRGV